MLQFLAAFQGVVVCWCCSLAVPSAFSIYTCCSVLQCVAVLLRCASFGCSFGLVDVDVAMISMLLQNIGLFCRI